MLQEGPVETRIVVPLRPLAELAAHEKEFFAGMAEHEAVKKAQIGELLPIIARHFSDHGTFSVDNLIMGIRQDEIFRESVQQAKSDFVVMIAAEDRILRYVIQSIVHPTHVPLEAET